MSSGGAGTGICDPFPHCHPEVLSPETQIQQKLDLYDPSRAGPYAQGSCFKDLRSLDVYLDSKTKKVDGGLTDRFTTTLSCKGRPPPMVASRVMSSHRQSGLAAGRENRSGSP